MKLKYPEYISLFKSIRNWCFENEIEFVIYSNPFKIELLKII